MPEEAVLLTVTWLLGQGRVEQARVLIETIASFFDRLRFFPPPAQGLPVSAAEVHVFAAGDVRQRLATLPGQARLAAQKRAIDVRYRSAWASCPGSRSSTDAKRSWWRRQPSGRDALAVLCAQRAKAELGQWNPAANGTILEQQQMLTTQNLALLFGDLGLNTLPHTRLDALALSCFEWICALPADADRAPSCATGDGQEHGICVAPDGVLPVHAR